MSDELVPDGASETALPTHSDAPASARDSPETDQIGPYRIVSCLGEGGMGTVYLAEQQEPVRREVALKVIKLGMDTEQVVARFDAERQALAIMTHPNVAKVLDAGVTADGRPYFAMEYVAGIPITEYCDRHQLTVRHRLELFIKACQGIQHAHQKGIIHRDVKPSNILVSEHDGEPVPSVIDFGIAKATAVEFSEDTALTQHGAVLGTPLYMSPEQAGISGLDVDTTADIYSLGMLLYELLVGALPFAPEELGSATWDDKVRVLWKDEATRPSDRLLALGGDADVVAMRRQVDSGALHRRLSGDLDWVVMKAIEKDRARRYESAAELAADIQRHLDHEPVEASPPSAAYRARKFVRRHRVGVAASVAVLLALVGGLAASAALYVRSEQQRAIAEASLDFLTGDLLGAVSPWAQGRNTTMLDVFEAASDQIDGRFPDQPLVEASIREALGRTYQQLSVNDIAARHLSRAVELRTRELGENDPDTLTAKHYLGVTLRAQSRYAEALEIFAAVLDARQRELGLEHLETLRTRLELGWAMGRQGDDPGAQKIHEENLSVLESKVGSEYDRLALQTKRLLALILENAGDLEGAQELNQEVLEGFSAALGASHPETLAAFEQVAVVTQKLGDSAAAVTMFRTNLEAKEEVFGPTHLQTLVTRTNLALALTRVVGKRREARALQAGTLEIARTWHGDDHETTLVAMNNLAITLGQLGDAEGALVLREEHLTRSTAVFGERDRRTLGSMQNLALLLKNGFDDAEGARPLEEKVLAVRTDMLGPEDPATVQIALYLADTLRRLGHLEASVEIGQKMVPIAIDVLGLRNPATTLANKQLVNNLNDLGRRDEAIVASQTLCWLLAEDNALC